MAKFVKGDVVVLPFPFTDLSSSKSMNRPAGYYNVSVKGNHKTSYKWRIK